MLMCKEWRALGFNWRLLRDRKRAWYYLERDNRLIAEGNRSDLLAIGWYY